MKKSSKTILIIAIVLFIIGIGVGVYFGIQSKQDSDKKIGELENQIAELKNNKEITDVNNNATFTNDIKKENQTSNSINNNSENNSIQNVSYNNANQAIKNALMDETWLKEEGLDTELQDGNTVWRTSMYIIKINDIENMPAYLIRCNVMDSSHTKLVTYKDDKVYVSKTSAGSDYCDEFVDIENNIVKSVSVSTDSTTIYKIKNYEFEILDEYDMEEESFEKYKEGSFKGILVEMTTENINKIVK